MKPYAYFCIQCTSTKFINLFFNSFHTKQILEPAKTPGRFFPLGSSVIDFPFGDIMPVAESMYREELIFVMYYAPWCAKSMQVRNEFQKAAKVMQNRVSFHVQ